MKKIYIECSCHSSEHLLQFAKFEDEPEVYVIVFLSNYNFFERLWKGIKYIFGYKCRYGHFGETILNKEAQKQIVQFLTEE